MGFKFKIYVIDWTRMSSFYVLYPVEYALSMLIVLTTLPVVKSNGSLVYFSFDFAVIYFLYMCLSLPHFLNTFIYLHRKRLQQLYMGKHMAD